MIRIIDAHDVVTGKVKYVEMWGKSTDEPLELDDGITIATGSLFIEIDTGNVYVFDEENSSWGLFGSSYREYNDPDVGEVVPGGPPTIPQNDSIGEEPQEQP